MITTELRKKRQDERMAKLAVRLNEIATRPEFTDHQWDWFRIAHVLGISASYAQKLVQWMRGNMVSEVYWTVGTADVDYMTVPTKSTREALNGLINQMKHLETRNKTMEKSWQTLSIIDPDPLWRAIAEKAQRFYKRETENHEDFRDTLMIHVRNINSATQRAAA